MTVRCPACGTRRSTFQLLTRHLQSSGHKSCRCGGYPYPHRGGSPDCEANVFSPLRAAYRAGLDSAEEALTIAAELAFTHPGRPVKPGTRIPF